jgi:basic amino acid/polyamine antiporter, APA family
MPLERPARLIRAIGRWSLFTLVLNSIIGSGVFKLPSDIAGLIGWWSPAGYAIAALGMGAIMATFAEVASQFDQAGGPYLYARETFGRFAGIQVGWLAWLVRLTSAAANANVFLLYLGEFWKPASAGAPRLIALTILLGGLAIANVRGVSGGANLSNIFAAAKLVPLLLFIGVGLFFLASHGLPATFPPPTVPLNKWSEAILLLVFAFGGFEGGLMSQGEARDPRRDVPFALMMALAVTTVIYALNQVVAQGALPTGSMSARPLADAARVMIGAGGAALISLGALVSVYGYLSSQMLNAPRLTFALAEGGDFPRFLTAVHPRFRTPWVSIALYAVLVWILTAAADFRWNATLSAVGRLFTYAAVCGALPALRRWQPNRPAFRLPGGVIYAAIGLLFCLAMISRMGRSDMQVIVATVLLAIANWWWVARRKA